MDRERNKIRQKPNREEKQAHVCKVVVVVAAAAAADNEKR